MVNQWKKQNVIVVQQLVEKHNPVANVKKVEGTLQVADPTGYCLLDAIGDVENFRNMEPATIRVLRLFLHSMMWLHHLVGDSKLKQ